MRPTASKHKTLSLQVSSYPSPVAALVRRAQLRTLLERWGIEASACYIKLDQHHYVAVIGSGPLKAADQRAVDRMFDHGRTPHRLSRDTIRKLIALHEEASSARLVPRPGRNARGA